MADYCLKTFFDFGGYPQISPKTPNTIAELTINAVMKPGHAQMTMKIINIAQIYVSTIFESRPEPT
ncbi:MULTISPECIES: hypothetical protein [Muribaculaceae]|nr:MULTISPECIES: hypothetical protein [Muribaculaceae]TGY05929.1 hypothetical protein E5354_02375 [Muribaculum sp. NM65_B17]THG43552.1 hypothetical protein E5985_04705 [Muribaculaceae bacterium]